MARIKHIAFTAEDTGKISDFYQDVFSQSLSAEGDGGDVWLTDGYMEFAWMPKTGDEQGIHHFGMLISEREKDEIYAKLEKYGCRPFRADKDLPALDHTFGFEAVLDIDGNRIDLKVGDNGAPTGEAPKVQHIAIFTERPKELGEFYCDVFGWELTGVTGRGAHWVTDGYVNVALLWKRKEKLPRGINHFGFIIEEDAKPHVYGGLERYGVNIFQPGDGNDRPFVEDGALDIEGNRFDLTSAVRQIDAEMARPRSEAELNRSELVPGE